MTEQSSAATTLTPAQNRRQLAGHRARILPVSKVEEVIVSTATVLGTLIQDADAIYERLMQAERLDMPACRKADHLRERTRYAYETLIGEPYA